MVERRAILVCFVTVCLLRVLKRRFWDRFGERGELGRGGRRRMRVVAEEEGVRELLIKLICFVPLTSLMLKVKPTLEELEAER
tara:strand:- start:136 stop:384 length:249 start_codon:yes stop_codon:yes gene_type:complete